MRVYEGEDILMRIYLNEDDKYHGRPVYHEIVDLLHKEKADGVTVLRGICGFGGDSKVHTASLLSLSKNLPIIIETIGKEEELSKLRPKIEEIFTDGLIVIQQVHVAKYKTSKGQ